MNIDELVLKYGDKLNKGELEVDASELYGYLLDLQDMTKEIEYKYKDTIRMLVCMLEQHSYDPHSFYDADILNNAKRLGKDN